MNNLKIGFGTNVLFKTSKDSKAQSNIPEELKEGLSPEQIDAFNTTKAMLKANGRDNETLFIYPKDERWGTLKFQYQEKGGALYNSWAIKDRDQLSISCMSKPTKIEEDILTGYYWAKGTYYTTKTK